MSADPRPPVRQEIRYTGRVQGVGFRATARACARRHPVTGWVRNEADRSVLLQIQGTAEAVDAALRDVRARMVGHIAGELVSPIPVVAGETSFEIAR